ncbi:MAG: cell division protein FtsQ/DivIB [Pseudomonadota bacterium]
MRSLMRRSLRPGRDPAPSRLAYRMHRLWLTPLVRLSFRVVLPVTVAFLAATYYLSKPETVEFLMAEYAEFRRQIEERPEFVVSLMAIDGGSIELSQDIREILPIDFPVSSFDLDLEVMREAIAELDAVASVSVRIRPGGVLQVEVTERIAAVVWRGPQGVELLDDEGRRVGPLIARSLRPELPLVAGEGANEAVSEALHLLEAAKPIAHRMRGLVRVGGRRWDVVLDTDQRILLPEDAPIPALERVISLAEVRDLFARSVDVIDMRLPHRPTVRISESGLAFTSFFNEIKAGVNTE